MLNKPQEEKHFECKVCTELVNTKDKLIVHLTRHNGGKQYKCDKKYSRNSSVNIEEHIPVKNDIIVKFVIKSFHRHH